MEQSWSRTARRLRRLSHPFTPSAMRCSDDLTERARGDMIGDSGNDRSGIREVCLVDVQAKAERDEPGRAACCRSQEGVRPGTEKQKNCSNPGHAVKGHLDHQAGQDLGYRLEDDVQADFGRYGGACGGQKGQPNVVVLPYGCSQSQHRNRRQTK